MNARSWMAVLVALGAGLLPLTAGEDSLAVAIGGQGHNGSAFDFEVNPGAALTFEVDELDERRRRSRSRAQPDAARHCLAPNEAAAHQLAQCIINCLSLNIDNIYGPTTQCITFPSYLHR